MQTARQMCEDGLVLGTSGNVSAREAGATQFLITPSGLDYNALTAVDLVAIDLRGRTVTGRLKPSSDTPYHAAIYRLRHDVCAIVHTHSTYATVFAVLHREIPPVLIESAGFLGGPVRVAEYLSPEDTDAADRIGGALGSSRALLLANHGVVAVGESVGKAYTAALLVEHCAHVAYLASLVGAPTAIPPADIERMHRFLHEEYGQRPAIAGSAPDKP